MTNLAKLRIAEHVLRTVIQDDDIADSQRVATIALVGRWINVLEGKVDRMVRA